ncbi:hypothetical protein MY1884_009530, partial [Beauveria asiatica]
MSGDSGTYWVKSPDRDTGRDWVNFTRSESVSEGAAERAWTNVDYLLVEERRYK